MCFYENDDSSPFGESSVELEGRTFTFVWSLVEVETVEFVFWILFGNRFVETEQNIVENLVAEERAALPIHEIFGGGNTSSKGPRTICTGLPPLA